MPEIYTKTHTSTCPGDLLEFIQANVTITSVLEQIIHEGPTLSFYFSTPLTVGEEAELDSILSTHVCPVYDFETMTVTEINNAIIDNSNTYGVGWNDLTSFLSVAKSPSSNFPTERLFGVSGLREELAFDVDDYVYVQPFHVQHDIDPGAEAYIHVHWSTDGTDTQPVKWEFNVMRALGHDQANFIELPTFSLVGTPPGTPWRHNITEVTNPADVIVLTEPDELLLITLRRVPNGATENEDSIFGLQVDLHYQTSRTNTPNRAPNFYT